MKGPLQLRNVLETIELDNYNRKYRDKIQRNKKQRRVSSVSSSKENKLPLPGQHGSEDRSTPTRRSRQSGIAIFAENQTGHRNTYAQHVNHNAMFARRLGTLPESTKATP